jgi:hypothetical protein
MHVFIYACAWEFKVPKNIVLDRKREKWKVFCKVRPIDEVWAWNCLFFFIAFTLRVPCVGFSVHTGYCFDFLSGE